ncbi:hypothetical protein RJT34_17820 [Clitoria ternatea]|uniref:Uncharacterized protein n=1 Tax=Clitoria ternatea TaxID=43366 RepID=A0AAN9PE30_CLITE
MKRLQSIAYIVPNVKSALEGLVLERVWLLVMFADFQPESENFVGSEQSATVWRKKCLKSAWFCSVQVGVDAVTAKEVGERYEGVVKNVEFSTLSLKKDREGDGAQQGNDAWVGGDKWVRGHVG